MGTPPRGSQAAGAPVEPPARIMSRTAASAALVAAATDQDRPVVHEDRHQEEPRDIGAHEGSGEKSQFPLPYRLPQGGGSSSPTKFASGGSSKICSTNSTCPHQGRGSTGHHPNHDTSSWYHHRGQRAEEGAHQGHQHPAGEDQRTGDQVYGQGDACTKPEARCAQRRSFYTGRAAEQREVQDEIGDWHARRLLLLQLRGHPTRVHRPRQWSTSQGTPQALRSGNIEPCKQQ